jgi:hypothetical protein
MRRSLCAYYVQLTSKKQKTKCSDIVQSVCKELQDHPLAGILAGSFWHPFQPVPDVAHEDLVVLAITSGLVAVARRQQGPLGMDCGSPQSMVHLSCILFHPGPRPPPLIQSTSVLYTQKCKHTNMRINMQDKTHVRMTHCFARWR